jgi:hypothetical protein
LKNGREEALKAGRKLFSLKTKRRSLRKEEEERRRLKEGVNRGRSVQVKECTGERQQSNYSKRWRKKKYSDKLTIQVKHVIQLPFSSNQLHEGLESAELHFVDVSMGQSPSAFIPPLSSPLLFPHQTPTLPHTNNHPRPKT